MKALFATVFATSFSLSLVAQSPPVTSLRSASYYLYTVAPPDTRAVAVSPEEMLANEQIDFPKMRAYGFNAVWLVEFRAKFDPALDNVYDEAGIANLRAELEAARQNGLSVFFGLNYGSGFQAVSGQDGTTALVAQVRFNSWLRFVGDILERIDDYRDMVFPVVFEEGQLSNELSVLADADEVARALRATIGSLPALLPPDLRARWQLGWYGAGTSAYSRTPAMQGYDWVGQGYYAFDPSIRLAWLPDSAKGLSDLALETSMASLFDRLEALYPGTPVVLAEGGYYTCDSATFARAAEVYALLARFAGSRGYGWNLWGYRTLLTPEEECAERNGKGGHALCNPDGSPRPAMQAIAGLLVPEQEPERVVTGILMPGHAPIAEARR